MVLASALSIQAGGGFAVLLFERMSPLGVASLRLTVAALIMLALTRPNLRTFSRYDWLLLCAFGGAMAGMSTLMYLAIARIPLGAAVTLEVLGPLLLSVLTARTAVSWLWAGLAAVGVFLLGRGGFAGLSLTGVVFALLAGAVWAAYIMLGARSAQRFPKAQGVAIAMCVAALLTLPAGTVTAGHSLLDPVTLALVAAVAAVSTVVPYTLENLALRSLEAPAFAVLMSLDPAIAAIAGFVLLGQALAPVEMLAIALVVVASASAVTHQRKSKPSA